MSEHISEERIESARHWLLLQDKDSLLWVYLGNKWVFDSDGQEEEVSNMSRAELARHMEDQLSEDYGYVDWALKKNKITARNPGPHPGMIAMLGDEEEGREYFDDLVNREPQEHIANFSPRVYGSFKG